MLPQTVGVLRSVAIWRTPAFEIFKSLREGLPVHSLKLVERTREGLLEQLRQGEAFRPIDRVSRAFQQVEGQ